MESLYFLSGRKGRASEEEERNRNNAINNGHYVGSTTGNVIV
jgi:hypothetical protein